MDREAWHAAVHGVVKSQIQVSNWTELTNLTVGFPGGANGKESSCEYR